MDDVGWGNFYFVIVGHTAWIATRILSPGSWIFDRNDTALHHQLHWNSSWEAVYVRCCCLVNTCPIVYEVYLHKFRACLNFSYFLFAFTTIEFLQYLLYHTTKFVCTLEKKWHWERLLDKVSYCVCVWQWLLLIIDGSI